MKKRPGMAHLKKYMFNLVLLQFHNNIEKVDHRFRSAESIKIPMSLAARF